MKGLLHSLGLGVGALVLILGAGYVALASTFGGFCETVVHGAVPAPSGLEKAIVYGRDCGAVATITSSTVAVGPSDVDDPVEDERATVVFRARVQEGSPLRRGGYGPEVTVNRRGDSTLVVSYDPRVEVRLAVIRSPGLTIQYDTLPLVEPTRQEGGKIYVPYTVVDLCESQVLVDQRVSGVHPSGLKSACRRCGSRSRCGDVRDTRSGEPLGISRR